MPEQTVEIISKLSENEAKQNEEACRTFLNKNKDKFTFSEVIQGNFLERCKNAGIWLQGLSPMVQAALIESINSICKTKKNIELADLDLIIYALQEALTKENHYLRQQYQINAAREGQEQPSIAQRLAKNETIPSSYWLQTADICHVLEPLRSYEAIFIHQPVANIDISVLQSVKAALDAKAQVAYVPVEKNGHWTLRIYTKQDTQFLSETYNPPGDGKCGDHVVKKIYHHAKQFLAPNDSVALERNSAYFKDSSTQASIVREQTITVISNSIQADRLRTSATDSFHAIKANTQTKAANSSTSLDSSAKSGHDLTTVFPEQRYSKAVEHWNQQANQVLDTIQNYSDADRAAAWDGFFTKVTEHLKTKNWSAIETKNWSPKLFLPTGCAAEAAAGTNGEQILPRAIN